MHRTCDRHNLLMTIFLHRSFPCCMQRIPIPMCCQVFMCLTHLPSTPDFAAMRRSISKRSGATALLYCASWSVCLRYFWNSIPSWTLLLRSYYLWLSLGSQIYCSANGQQNKNKFPTKNIHIALHKTIWMFFYPIGLHSSCSQSLSSCVKCGPISS